MSLFVFLLFFIQCHGSEGNLEDKLFIKTAIAYDKLQIFLKDYSLKLNMDAMYGIILAEGFLIDALSYPLSKPVATRISDLLKKTDELKKYGDEVIFKNSNNQNDLLSKILNVEMWQRNATFNMGKLLIKEPVWRDYYIYFGRPDEPTSDLCLRSLLKDNVKKRRECPILPDCREIYFDLKHSHGYALTHKYLFWQVFNRYNCIDHYNSEIKKAKLCSLILSEAEGILEDGLSSKTLDLFLEMILLCGGEGYEEFVANRSWLKLLLSKQSDNGCYRTNFDRNSRKKRETYSLTENCQNHVNGLGLGVLALYLKYLSIINLI